VVGNVRVVAAGEWDRSAESLMSGGVRSGRQSSDGVAVPTRNGRTGTEPHRSRVMVASIHTMVYLHLPLTYKITFLNLQYDV